MLDQHFPEGQGGVEIIAEPGRFFAESTYALALNVHSRRIVQPKNNLSQNKDNREFQYYLSDGVYGSFNCILFDHQSPKIHLLRPDEEAAIRTSTMFGARVSPVSLFVMMNLNPADSASLPALNGR